MQATLVTPQPTVQTPFARLGMICARVGLDLANLNSSILERMRLLASATETVRDCERSAELAEEIFRYDDSVKPSQERFTALERRTVVIGSLFSDIGKTGPERADADGQQLVAEIFAVEHVPDETMSVMHFFDTYCPVDASQRVRRFRALDLDPEMSMRQFWNLHSVWTLEILRGDGVPREAVTAAAAHHLLENVNPHTTLAEHARFMRHVGNGATFDRAEKLVILLDKYDAARRRGQRAHEETIAWLRKLIEDHPHFCEDREFFLLIDTLDAAMKRGVPSHYC